MTSATRNDYDTDALVGMVENGMTLSQIADLHDVSNESVRLALFRRGIKNATPESRRSVRSIAEDMRPIDAVEYLLGVIDAMQDAQKTEVSVIDGWGVQWTIAERRILEALVIAPGSMKTKDQIYNASYFDRADADDLPDIKVIDVQICKIRKKLPPKIGTISTFWGRGYQFDFFEGGALCPAIFVGGQHG